jgi:hypothetical protein
VEREFQQKYRKNDPRFYQNLQRYPLKKWLDVKAP